MENNATKPTRRKRKDSSKGLVIMSAALTLALIGVLIWGGILLSKQQEPQPHLSNTDGTTAPTTSTPTQTKPTEPKPTESKPTQSQPSVPNPDPEPDPEPDPAPNPEPDPAPNPEPDPKPDPKPDPQPDPEPDPKPNPEPDPEVKDPTIVAAEQTISAFAAEHGLTLADYPQKLIELLARKPEAEEYVLNFPFEYGKDHPIDISGYADYEGVPLFIQWDKQWGYLDYTGNVAGLAACGPTCMSMIMYHFTRDPQYTPAYMMRFAESNSSYAVKGYGTQWAFFKLGGRELGLDVKELNSDQIASEAQIAKIVNSGRIIVMNVRPGVFTTVGHYLLVVGYEDGKFRVNDPNSRINSEKLWEFEEFSDQIRMMWSFAL